MRVYPIIPIYLIAPLAIAAVALFVLCMAKKKLRVKKNMRRIAMLVLMSLILLRPVFINGLAQSETNNLNIFFVVDATYSMRAEDVGGWPRHRKVAKDIYDIAKALPGSRFSIIIEDNAIYTAVPMSTSVEFLSSVWDEKSESDVNASATAASGIVAPKSQDYSNGTDLNSLLEEAGKKISRYEKNNPTRNNIFIFMSDGEDFSDGISKQPKLREVIDGGAVFGYGSENGSKIISDSSIYGYVTYGGSDSSIITEPCGINSFGRCVVSKINESSLKKVATDLNINYYHRENGDIPRDLINDIKKKEEFTGESTAANSYIDIYWVFSMLLLGLLLWDFRDVLDNVMREREYKHA